MWQWEGGHLPLRHYMTEEHRRPWLVWWGICCLGIRAGAEGLWQGKVMGSQVCALGPQPGEAPLLFLAGEKTKPAYVRGKPSRVYPCYKMTQRHISQNRSGNAGLGPCQLKARRWGSVSVSSVWQRLRFEGLEVGRRENSSQTILRLVWGHWMLTKSPSSTTSLPPT